MGMRVDLLPPNSRTIRSCFAYLIRYVPSWCGAIALTVLLLSSMSFGAAAADKSAQAQKSPTTASEAEITIDNAKREVTVQVKGATDDKDWSLLMNNTAMNLAGKPSPANGGLKMSAPLPPCTQPGSATFSVRHGSQIIKSEMKKVEPLTTAAGTQPDITDVKPRGGPEGEEITVTGNQLGDDLKDVVVCLFHDQHVEQAKVLSLTKPSDDKKTQQVLKFQIPDDLYPKERILLPLYYEATIIVKGQPAQGVPIVVVGKNFYGWLRLPAVLLVLILAAFIGVIARKENFRTLFIDRKTNTYSLSKCQAVAWTTVLIGSYFYYAIGRTVIVENGVPDFNASLLPLLGVSYAGTLISRSISVYISKKDMQKTPPSLKDLVSEGGELEITRLQLVCFNITAIVIYLWNLSGPDLLTKGLPDIPQTLLGLLGVSQSGYLLGKVTGGKTVVNFVLPRYVKAGDKGLKLSLVGTGFLDKTKVLIQDIPDPQPTTLMSSTMLSLNIPDVTFTQPGSKQIIFIPPAGSSIPVDNAFDVVSLKSIIRNGTDQKKATITLEGFDYETGLKVTAPDNPVVDVTYDSPTGTVTFTARDSIAVGSKVIVSTQDGSLVFEGTVTEPAAV